MYILRQDEPRTRLVEDGELLTAEGCGPAQIKRNLPLTEHDSYVSEDFKEIKK